MTSFHHHHISFMELGHLLTRSGLMYPEISSKNLSSFFPWDLPMVKISSEWGYGPRDRVSPVVGLLPLASGSACLGMAFPPFLVKQLYRCDSVAISSFVRTGYTTRRWGWLLGRICYSITHHYPLRPEVFSSNFKLLCSLGDSDDRGDMSRAWKMT